MNLENRTIKEEYAAILRRRLVTAGVAALAWGVLFSTLAQGDVEQRYPYLTKYLTGVAAAACALVVIYEGRKIYQESLRSFSSKHYLQSYESGSRGRVVSFKKDGEVS